MLEKEFQTSREPEQETGTGASADSTWHSEHPFMLHTAQVADRNRIAPDQTIPGEHNEPNREKQSGDSIKALKLKTGDSLSGDGLGLEQVLTLATGEQLRLWTVPGTSVTIDILSKRGDPVELHYRSTIMTHPETALFTASNGATVEMRDDGGQVSFADGAKVVYDRGGICSVSRGGLVEKLHAPQYDPVKEIKPFKLYES